MIGAYVRFNQNTPPGINFECASGANDQYRSLRTPTCSVVKRQPSYGWNVAVRGADNQTAINYSGCEYCILWIIK